MKRYLIPLLMLTLSFVLTGCREEQELLPAETPVVEEMPGEEVGEPAEIPGAETDASWQILNVAFDEAEETISYTIQNDGDTSLSYGAGYSIEKMNGYAKWEDSFLMENMAFDMMLRIVEPGQSELISFPLSDFGMKTGAYRIVRAYSSEEMTHLGAVYFSVDEDLNYDYFEAEIMPGERFE